MGSVHSYATAAGKRYRVAYRKPDHSQGVKRGFTTKRKAEIYLASVTTAKATGTFIDEAESRITIDTLGIPWLATRTHLKPSAREPIEIAWRLYVQPQWGETQISAIRHTDVQAWISNLSTGKAKTVHPKPGPRSATVVLRAYGVLAAILDDAVKDRRILANNARGAVLPRKTKRPHTYLSHAQVELLTASAGEHSTMLLLLAYTGLRWGEAVGLRVQDIQALKRRVSVRENAVRVGGSIVVGTPKSNAARTVPYPEFLSIPLAKQCEGKSESALVFGRGLAHMKTPSSGDGWYVAAIRRARLIDPKFPGLTIHDLRHTAASLAISSGANVKAVQRMLGHASAAMTLDVYADLFDDDMDAVAEALNHAKNNSSVVKVLSETANIDAVVTAFPSK